MCTTIILFSSSRTRAKFYFRCAFLLGLSVLSFSRAQADSWTTSDGEHASASADVQKWCLDHEVIFSNVSPVGYVPCGEVSLKSYCSASGKKYIGTGNPPYGYLPCTGKPRIQIPKSDLAKFQETDLPRLDGTRAKSLASPAHASEKEDYTRMLDGLLGDDSGESSGTHSMEHHRSVQHTGNSENVQIPDMKEIAGILNQASAALSNSNR